MLQLLNLFPYLLHPGLGERLLFSEFLRYGLLLLVHVRGLFQVRHLDLFDLLLKSRLDPQVFLSPDCPLLALVVEVQQVRLKQLGLAVQN